MDGLLQKISTILVLQILNLATRENNTMKNSMSANQMAIMTLIKVFEFIIELYLRGKHMATYLS